MPGGIVTAGIAAADLRHEVRFLERAPELVREAGSGGELVEAVERERPDLAVLGTGLADTALAEVIRRVRASAAGQHTSILALAAAEDPPGTEGALLAAGANAVLRRPLGRFVLESWVGKLVDVAPRVRARVAVRVQVVGTRPSAPGEHFYALSRNLSVHGMLLASPVAISGEDVELELDLPQPDGRVRVLGRIARRATEIGWPYCGYGIEFLVLPEPGRRAIERMVERESPPEPPRRLWAPGAIHSTLRREDWVYELTEPARTETGFLVEIRRATRDDWRPGCGTPFSVVRADGAREALEAARDFVRRHG